MLVCISRYQHKLLREMRKRKRDLENLNPNSYTAQESKDLGILLTVRSAGRTFSLISLVLQGQPHLDSLKQAAYILDLSAIELYNTDAAIPAHQLSLRSLVQRLFGFGEEQQGERQFFTSWANFQPNTVGINSSSDPEIYQQHRHAPIILDWHAHVTEKGFPCSYI